MITCKSFGTVDGKSVELYTLSDKISVQIATCRATLVAMEVPNAQGGKTDVLLGMTTPEEILSPASAYMGTVVGRCANRIADGKFTLEGKEYQLDKNDGGVNSLHGGKLGFNKRIYKAHVDGDSLILSAESADGEENYPAFLAYSVKYTVKDSKLIIEYMAESDGTTLFAPTNHAYFNLDGQDYGDISQNVMQIFADKYLPVDKHLIPTGEERPVKGTPFDFTSPKPIGQDISASDEQLKIAGGYDHNFCLNGSHVAHVYSTKTGITMDCYTDRCGVQFYSGNFLHGEKGKTTYPKRSGFCLETQTYPNAINMPQWQQPILKKGEKFYSKTEYVFGII